ncbi:hypothetical protein ACFL0Q_00610 [Thermodesulfobacteriota bacterium]
MILQYAHDSARALLQALRTVRSQRQARRGVLTDEEQDLLRAMLVMAASGLDSVVKQLIRDALPILCRGDSRVLSRFQTYVARQVRGDAEGHVTNDVSKLLARVLTADSPQAALIESYVYALTGSSLQSVDELFKVASALDVPQNVIAKDTLVSIFEARNDIIHELDIDFDAPRRNRRNRRIPWMIQSANELLLLAERFYAECERKMNEVQPVDPSNQ